MQFGLIMNLFSNVKIILLTQLIVLYKCFISRGWVCGFCFCKGRDGF